MTKVLFLEDDESFSSEMTEYLSHNGFDVTCSHNISDFESILKKDSFDILILDQKIGKNDMIASLFTLTKTHKGAIVFISGNTNEIERVFALEVGADDFIVKTQSPREILARLRAAARSKQTEKPQMRQTDPSISPPAGVPSPDSWKLDLVGRAIQSPDGQVISLTGSEFEIMRALAAMPGEVVPRDSLYERVLHRTYIPKDRTLDALISRLRTKLDPHRMLGEVITSVRGTGYACTLPVITGPVSRRPAIDMRPKQQVEFEQHH